MECKKSTSLSSFMWGSQTWMIWLTPAATCRTLAPAALPTQTCTGSRMYWDAIFFTANGQVALVITVCRRALVIPNRYKYDFLFVSIIKSIYQVFPSTTKPWKF